MALVYVHFYVIRLGSPILAKITGKRLFAGMREHVPLQVVRTLECSVTNIAMSVAPPSLRWSYLKYLNNLQPTFKKPLLLCRVISGHVTF